MIRKIIVFILIWAFPYFSQNSSAQDSLRLLATIVGERECASAGDVNGDGFKDIVTGYYDEGGYIKIFLGGFDFDTIPDITIFGDGGGYGKAVGCAGDLNNDGYDDIVVGAPWAYNYNNQAELAGKAYVFLGGSPMDTVVDVILQDSDYRYMQGYCVSSAGDVNGDGYDDVLVAAPDDWAGAGRVFIYFGGENMDSVYDVRIEGPPDSSENFGWSVAGIGNINSDGYDDVLIGRPYAGVPWGTGKASIYFGGNPMDTIPDIVLQGDITTFYNFGRNVSSAKDIDGDDIPDILVSNTKKTKVFSGDYLTDTSIYITLPVGYSVSYAGDVNQDGYSDVIASDDKYPQSTYIFYGGKNMDEEADIILKAEDTTLAGFGLKVAYLGDINKDCYSEVMVSSGGNSLYPGIFFIFTSNPTSVEESRETKLKITFNLDQNYPNPFNIGTIINFSVVSKADALVVLRIHNVLGQTVRTLVNQKLKNGKYQVTWNGTNDNGEQVSSGIYIYELRIDNSSKQKKMVFLK